MPISHALILGIIQGLTEVFPISSSAHLTLIPWFFKWNYQGLSFDVALHVGTALALVVYFFKDWIKIITSAFTKDKTKKNNILWYIVLATIPGAVIGLIFENAAEFYFRAPLLMAATLTIFAIILWLADHFGKKDKEMDAMDLKSAIIIGFAQALAIIPGVSRSGITITAGLANGLSRRSAARFSFLLATPIIVAAGVLKLPKLHASDLTAAFWIGVFASAVSGYLGVKFLLNLVRKSSLDVFVWYRIAMAVVIVALFFR